MELLSEFLVHKKLLKVIPEILIALFQIGIHSIQGWTVTKRHGVTRKKTEKLIGKLFRNEPKMKGFYWLKTLSNFDHRSKESKLQLENSRV